MALFIVGVILIGSALSLPWWIRSNTNGVVQTSYLTSGCTDGRCVSFEPFPPLADMWGLVEALMVAALVLAFVALAAFLVSLSRPRVRPIVLLSGIGGATLLLAAPVYLFFVLPGTMSLYSPYDVVGSYFGSCTPGPGVGCSSAETWGAGAGWFLSIAASALLTISTLTADRLRRRSTSGP